MYALISALATLTPIPTPLHDGELLEQLCDESSFAVDAINVMLHRAVRERTRQRAEQRSYDTPADRLCDRLYRLHGRACDRSMRRMNAMAAWRKEHTCPGIERDCGCSALNAYHTATGTDMETARPVTLWYCDRHFHELRLLSASPDGAAALVTR